MTSPTQISDEVAPLPVADERLQELKALAEKATPGPWEIKENKDHRGSYFVYALRKTKVKDFFLPYSISKDNAEHIAACSPDRILSLLDRLEKAEKRAARYEETLRWISNGGHWNDGLKSVQEYARQALGDDSEANREGDKL